MAKTIEAPDECSVCGKAAVFAHPKGGLKHCFACGTNTATTPLHGMQAVLGGVFKHAHAQLLKNKKTMRLLTGERNLHRQVLVDSMVGLASTIDVAASCTPELDAAETRLAHLQDARAGKRGRPSKADQTSLDEAAAEVEGLRVLKADLGAFLDEHPGRLLFFYTTAEHRIVGIHAESLDGSARAEFEVNGGGGVFNHALFAAKTRARSLEPLQDRTIVVASEFDALQLQSLAARLAEEEGLRPEAGYLRVAAVGPSCVDTETLKKLGRMPLFLKNSVNAERGRQIVEEVRQALNLHGVTVPGGQTLDEFIRTQPVADVAGQSIVAAVANATLILRPLAAVRRDIDDWRKRESPRGLKPFQVDRFGGRTLLEDINERGQLFFDGRQAYVFLSETKELLPVDRDNGNLQALLDEYGAAPNDRFFRHALNALRLAAQERGTKTTVHSLAHYDRATNRVYLFDHDRWVYRISSSKIEKVDNGTDGVLFIKNPKWEPFVIGEPTGDAKAVTHALMGSVRLRDETLSRDELDMLFGGWLCAMFFSESFPTRPLLAVIGEKGSGKTSVLRRIGRLLFGRNFQVMGMSHEPRDFDAAVTGDAFVGIDNADANISWLDDKLAVVATGGTLKRRSYYTTNNLVEFPITAFVGITSRTPHFKREDVADRLLLFHVERLETFGAEGDLLNELANDRNRLMTELVGQLQRVLHALEKTKGKTYETSFRIADFAQFILKIADAEGRLVEAEEMLNRLGAEQLAFTTQDDPVIELLDVWVRDNEGRQVTTFELFSELKDLAAQSRPVRVLDFKTAIGFGQYLQGNKATLRALFEATDRTVGGRKRVWSFHAPAGGTETVKSESENDDPTSLLEEVKKLPELRMAKR